MRVRIFCIAGAVIAGLALTSCAAPPKQALTPGYYIAEYPEAGVDRRIVITAGTRRASYDIWRVSTSGDGTALHAHYDLIASDEVPRSGTFTVTQDGSDCGTLTIEPYAAPRSNVGALEVRRGMLGVEHFVLTGPSADANGIKVLDGRMSREIVQVAGENPRLYGRLSFFYKFVYGELTPRCEFD